MSTEQGGGGGEEKKKTFKWAKSAPTPAPSDNPFDENYSPMASEFAPSPSRRPPSAPPGAAAPPSAAAGAESKPLPPVPSKARGTEKRGPESSSEFGNPFLAEPAEEASAPDWATDDICNGGGGEERGQQRDPHHNPHLATGGAAPDGDRKMRQAAAELDSLRAQVRSLAAERSQLRTQLASEQRGSALSTNPAEIFDRYRQCLPCCVDSLRSLGDKAAFLDAAEACDDPCAQAAALDAVAASLDVAAPAPAPRGAASRQPSGTDIFHDMLTSRPRLAATWEAHLRACGRTRELVLFLRSRGRERDEAMLRLRQAYASRDPQRRLALLRDALAYIGTAAPHRGLDATLVEAMVHQADLLDRQLKIEAHDAAVAASGKEEIYAVYPRRCILFAPLAFTVHYALTYHPFADKSKLSSPVGMRKHFGVSDRTYEYLCLKARARVADWETVRKLPKQKGFFTKSPHSKIGFRMFVEAIAQAKAPRELQIEFAAKITDPEERYAVAMRHHLYDLAVDALHELKDQVKLIELRNHLVERYGSEVTATICKRILDTVHDGKTKWRRLVNPEDI